MGEPSFVQFIYLFLFFNQDKQNENWEHNISCFTST